jgi:nucleotide-binding universal stress UspA family protein
MVAEFAAELAARHRARLILQHVIKPQERAEVLAGRTMEDIEEELHSFVSDKLQRKISVEAIVVQGDPTQELLYQARTQQADLIVLGAQGASAFAAIARSGVVYKVLAHAQCPVITLSPAILGEYKMVSTTRREYSSEVFLAGVF